MPSLKIGKEEALALNTERFSIACLLNIFPIDTIQIPGEEAEDHQK